MKYLYGGTKITNTEETNTSFICEFSLMPMYDYKAQSIENSKTKGHQAKISNT